VFVKWFQSHNGAIAAQGKILGFEGKRKGNGEGVAVDLRLPENPKGVDGNWAFKIGLFWAKIATSPLFGFQGAQNGLGRRQV
jgi:hypothetical protein